MMESGKLVYCRSFVSDNRDIAKTFEMRAPFAITLEDRRTVHIKLRSVRAKTNGLFAFEGTIAHPEGDMPVRGIYGNDDESKRPLVGFGMVASETEF